MTTPDRFYPESDGGDTGGRKLPRTFYLVDRTGEQDRIDCQSLLEAERLAGLLNLDPVKLREVLADAWEDGYVVVSLLKSMSIVHELIESTDVKTAPPERAHEIVSHVAAVGIFRDAFLRRVLPDGRSFESMEELTLIAMIHMQLEAVWKAWKEEPDA